MNGYRFLLEYETDAKRRKATRRNLGDHQGTVIALSTQSPAYSSGRDTMQEGYTSIYGWGDSPVSWGPSSRRYLRTRTLRISEAQARQIHPALFKRLSEDAEREAREQAKEPLVILSR